MDRNKASGAIPPGISVALRKESVDRNASQIHSVGETITVALRKESVDRNIGQQGQTGNASGVALRKESVDRNIAKAANSIGAISRSPQGERG